MRLLFGPSFSRAALGWFISVRKWCPEGISAGVIQHVHRRLLTSPLRRLRCLDPAAEVRRDWPLPPENSSTTSSVELCCPTRGKVSKAIIGHNELFVGRGAPQTLFGNPVFGENHFVCLKLVQRHEPWNKMRGGCPLRWTCYASCRLWTGNFCCTIVPRVFRVMSTPSSQFGGATDSSFVSFRVRSMWQVCTDNLDVLEVCDLADLQELTESGQNEGIAIARERYKRFQVPRSPGNEVIRAPQTEALSDQIDGFQGVVGVELTFEYQSIPWSWPATPV